MAAAAIGQMVSQQDAVRVDDPFGDVGSNTKASSKSRALPLRPPFICLPLDEVTHIEGGSSAFT